VQPKPGTCAGGDLNWGSPQGIHKAIHSFSGAPRCVHKNEAVYINKETTLLSVQMYFTGGFKLQVGWNQVLPTILGLTAHKLTGLLQARIRGHFSATVCKDKKDAYILTCTDCSTVKPGIVESNSINVRCVTRETEWQIVT
jgi:hypothetical protein